MKKAPNTLLAKLAISITLLVTFAVNMAAVLLPLNNLSTKDISDSFQVYFVPASYVFSIWSVIYAALIAMAVYMWTMKGPKADELISKIALPLVVINISNAVWLFTWHYQVFYAGVFVMLLFLVTLILLFLRVQNFDYTGLGKRASAFFRIPVGIYLGWITVATVANVTDVLWLLNWEGFGILPQVWAALLILVACILAVLMLIRHSNYAYAAVIVWAVTGIAQKFPQEQQITVAVLIGVFAIVVVATLKALGKLGGKNALKIG